MAYGPIRHRLLTAVENGGAFSLSSSNSSSYDPSFEFSSIGFRLAAVPEPSTYAMAVVGLACGGYSMFRRRRGR